MPTGPSLTTIGHLASEVSQRNFCQLKRKWARWKLSESEHKWLDLTDCRFFGEGGHEITVFTFSRHLRLSRLLGQATYPAWVAAGPHWSDRWHDLNGLPYQDLPLIGIFRGISDLAGFIEPLRVLGVISCTNAQFVYDEIMRRLSGHAQDSKSLSGMFGNPRFRRFSASVDALLAAAAEVCALPCPALKPAEPQDTGCGVSIGLDQIGKYAQKWEDFVDARCTVVGTGRDVVYAYTYTAIEDAAYLAGDRSYPVKVGWTASNTDTDTGAQAAISRIGSQVPFAEPVRVLALLCCHDGQRRELQLHRQLKARQIKCIGREWFASSREEVVRLIGY